MAATEAFVAFMRAYVEARRTKPRDDLITHLIAAEAEGEKLTTDELITTCILLLNAGHEATVHTHRQRREDAARNAHASRRPRPRPDRSHGRGDPALRPAAPPLYPPRL